MPEESDSKTTAAPAKRPAPGTRRLPFLLVIGIAALVLLIVVPGYMASRPQFFQRYPSLEREYATWSTSAHAQSACAQCHIPPNGVDQLRYRIRMTTEFYLSLALPAREPEVFATPTSGACRVCHVDLRTVSPAGDVKIPHLQHVDQLKIDCVECHTDLIHTTNPRGTHHPTMVGCMTCHDGKKAPNDCASCHTEKGFPLSHRSPDWVIVHPDRQKGGKCTQCHKWTANWCAQCHAKRPRSHVANWRTVHGEQVKVRRNCEACHEAEFCIRCHGVVPKLNFDPKLQKVQ